MKALKLILPMLAAACTACLAAQAQEAQTLLGRTAGWVKALGAYGAEFSVTAGDYAAVGSYRVDGDTYYIIVDRAEVYSDGRTRYEVDNERREVNVDDVDTSSRNILDNPTRCFDFVGTDYISDIYSRDEGVTTLHLRAADPKVEGDIYLTVADATGRPQRIVYVLYDDRIEVDITDIFRTDTPVKSYDRSRYAGYEEIDFR